MIDYMTLFLVKMGNTCSPIGSRGVLGGGSRGASPLWKLNGHFMHLKDYLKASP